MESGGRKAPLRRQLFGEDHDLEIAGADSSVTTDEEIIAVEVGARIRCNEVEIR